MSDSYQAIYDAVRSRIHGGNVSDAVTEVARHAFDISHAVNILQSEFAAVAYEQQRPFVLLKPSIGRDGNKWRVLYGSNLAEGVAGYGDSPAEASYDFDKAWAKKIQAVD